MQFEDMLHGPRVIYQHELLTDFITALLASAEDPISSTTLVICSTREHFISQLQLAVEYASKDGDDQQTNTTRQRAQHSLTIPTLNLLSQTQNINLAYCPTISHLRAYLSIFHPKKAAPTSQYQTTQSQNQARRPTLVILNPIASHKTTSEFSAQSLSQTFALATETALKTRMRLVLCQCAHLSREKAAGESEYHEGVEVGAREAAGSDDGETVISGQKPWEAQVPLINRSVKLPAKEQIWAEKTISLKRVAERWFDFV